MSLSRNESEPKPTEQKQSPMGKSFQQMAEQMEELGLLAKDRESAARQNKELYMLLMTMAKFGQIQEDFLKNTVVVLHEQNKHQLKLLSVQNEYAKSLRDSTTKIVADIYQTFQNEQEKAFEEIQQHLAIDTEEMIKKINRAAIFAEKAAENAVEAAENIENTEKWKVLLFYLSPLCVIIDIAIRVIMFFQSS